MEQLHANLAWESCLVTWPVNITTKMYYLIGKGNWRLPIGLFPGVNQWYCESYRHLDAGETTGSFPPSPCFKLGYCGAITVGVPITVSRYFPRMLAFWQHGSTMTYSSIHCILDCPAVAPYEAKYRFCRACRLRRHCLPWRLLSQCQLSSHQHNIILIIFWSMILINSVPLTWSFLFFFANFVILCLAFLIFFFKSHIITFVPINYAFCYTFLIFSFCPSIP